MVLDDDDGVSFVSETVEDVDKLTDVIEVEPDGGFLDEVEVLVVCFGALVSDAAFGEFSDELEALSLSTAEGGARLSDLEIA